MPLSSIAQAARAGRVTVYGATAPYAAWIAADQAASDSTVVVVTATEESAVQLASDVGFFHLQRNDDGVPTVRSLHVAAHGIGPYAELSPDRSALAARMAALYRLRTATDTSAVIVLSARSLMRRVIAPEQLDSLSAVVTTGSQIDRDATAELLVRAGYARVSVVEDHGTFAVRGGVLDLFPSLYSDPVRIELFGDDVESIRSFDPATQRTLREMGSVHIHPVRETIATAGSELRKKILEAADIARHPSKETRQITQAAESGEEFVGIEVLTPAFHRQMTSVLDYLPGDATWLFVDPERCLETVTDALDVAATQYQARIDSHKLAFPPSAHFVDVEELVEHRQGAARLIDACPIEPPAPPPHPIVRVSLDDNHLLRRGLERVRHEDAAELMRPLVDAISKWSERGLRVVIATASESRQQRLLGLLTSYGLSLDTVGEGDLLELPEGVPTIVPRRLSGGFTSNDEGIAIITDDEIFGQRRNVTARQRQAARRARKALMGGGADFSDLEAGNYLVHQLHGIGAYRGLVKLPVAESTTDFLHIDYQGGTLYLPVYRMGEVGRYIGTDGREPRLDRLGGLSWSKSRRKASKAIHALAEKLLQLYAQRTVNPGHAFAPRDALFDEFEATFEFEETPDQKKAIDDVIADMEAAKPMDRLVCGDVGYGKTEVALRATLKAVLDGKQVAILAPTTVLVEQHYQTLVRRFAGWPVTIAKLSRFQSRAKQLETVRAVAEGRVDAVVGTHRLLSKDVRFRDLGLLVVDEEQRFGVTHKERLKQMRAHVDALTLTATPIPRTLHLAMTGLRDLSIIATPPADRRSIRTFVAKPDDQVLRDAVSRELARGGQIFFVSPRIEARPGTPDRSIEDWAEKLRELFPEARVAVAHGQMKEATLERVMIGFVDGDTDILVSTAIVESGLDIPRANTMLIANADRFGLAQLYQLRGRIGRSRERAFCYLLVPARGKLTDDARRRLEALQRFSDLGAGFAIASQDLELRGAGELLGAKQSGSIATVGFETYAQLLEEAVAELRGEEIHRVGDPELNVSEPGYIPEDLVPDTGQRLVLYKRLASAEDADEIRELLEEIADRYGPIPKELEHLGELMLLKGLAKRIGVQSLELSRDRMTLAFVTTASPVDPARLTELISREAGRYRLTPDMRLRCQLEPSDSSPMASAKATLLELGACVTST